MPPVNRSLNQLVRHTLYRLKLDYGARVDIYHLVDTTTDVRTGEKTIIKVLYPIQRAIVLPMKIDRGVKQGISLISSNKEFVTGGTTDKGTRDFIIDRLDCPSLPELTADDWLVYDGGKYQIKNVQEMEIRAGWIVTATQLIGEVPEQFITGKTDHWLAFQSVATATVN